MGDSDTEPLLTRGNSIESEAELPKPLRTLDDKIERCIGKLGAAQLLQATLVSLAWAFDAQQTFISVFTDSQPTWHCTQLDVCRSTTQPCELPTGSWSWDESPHTSIISEWNLTCSGAFYAGLPASSFFIGCLVGGLALATLADSSFGRKKMLFFSCLTMSIAGLLTALTRNLWIYSFLKFVNGFGRATIGTCALVLSTEIVGKRWRGEVGIMGFVFFTLGFLSLPGMAYINRANSWRNLYIWTSGPAFLYCILVYFLVRESPRWLLVRGRKEEAIETLKSISTTTGSSWNLSFSGIPTDDEPENVNIYSAIYILLEKSWALRRLAAVMMVGFGTGMVYYGMPLAVGNLPFNQYLSVTFNALSELPSALITFFLIGSLNRRISVLFFTGVSGIFSILCLLMANYGGLLQMGIQVVSFFSACTAFNVLLIYTLELFPTCVRNSALSMVRQALVLGGVFSPILVAAGRKDGFLSFGVFGIMIAGAGLFVICLPETRGTAFCDTIEEQEYKDIPATLV